MLLGLVVVALLGQFVWVEEEEGWSVGHHHKGFVEPSSWKSIACVRHPLVSHRVSFCCCLVCSQVWTLQNDCSSGTLFIPLSLFWL